MLLGLHATSAPRRHDYHHPINEKYSFVPYSTDAPVQSSDVLQQYVAQCSQQAFNGFTAILKLHADKDLKNKEQIEAVIENATVPTDITDKRANEKHHSYLSVLEKLFQINYDESFAKSFNDLVSQSESLQLDPLFNQLIQADTLKPCLDLVVENCLNQHLKIMEVSGEQLINNFMPFTSSHPLLHASFTLSTLATKESTDELSVVNWSPSDKPPQSLQQKFNLVLANNILHKQSNIKVALCNVCECLADGAFLLVQEVTSNFHLALPIDGVGSGVGYDDLASRNCNIYCTAEKWRNIFSEEGLEIIYERSDSCLHTIFLLRKSATVLSSHTIINLSDVTCSWVDSLKDAIPLVQSKPKGENLWLVADGNVNGIVGLVNCLRQEPGGERIR